MELLILAGLMAGAYGMLAAKRMSALIGSFRVQSFFLCLLTFVEAFKTGSIELYAVSILIFLLKVVLIPYFLIKIIKEINANENLGFFINPQLSLAIGLIFMGVSWAFSGMLFFNQVTVVKLFGTVSFSIVLIGMFIMIFRITAIAQVLGILVMENGLFVLASAVSGGMPFIVEMAIFFDVFISVVILGIFVYRINNLFVSIDVDQLNSLKG